MARFNITLPNSIAEMLDRDAERQEMARSTLIAQYIEQHYEGKSEADFQAEMQQFRAESAQVIQRERSEHERRVQKLIAEHEAELQQLRADCEKQVQQTSVDNAATNQQFEEELEQLESITKKLDNDLKTSEEHKTSVMEKLQQLETSKNTVVTGLQHEIELLKQKVANLETLLHTESGLTSELRRDKDNLQKQLELVTLRLPAPKVGFWARVFSRERKEEK